MAETIWKFPVDVNPVEMPLGARIVHFGVQNHVPMVWAIVDPEVSLTRPHRFVAVGTGHPIPTAATYVGTWHDGPFVWHIFEELTDG